MQRLESEMRLTLKTWISNGDEVRAKSLFGVVNTDNPDMLPTMLASGHWEVFRTFDESNFKLAEEAKNAISKKGYYLFGAGVHVSELVAE
jgi:hypothetical protein